LYDLIKLYSGSAEMYWRGAFPGLSLETHPQLGGEVTLDKDATKDMMEDYMNGLQRYLAMEGITAKSLAPQVVDPTPQIDTQIEAICIQIGVPKRIFTGSERGELASSQDAKSWAGRMKNRQETYLTPRIIVPFIDRLILLGILPIPTGFSIEWPDMFSLSDDDKATIAAKRTEALAKYIMGDVQQIITPFDYLTRELGYSDDEAQEIIDTAIAKMEEEEEALREEMEAEGFVKTSADGFERSLEEEVARQDALSQTTPTQLNQ
jgi:hypothetical protein